MESICGSYYPYSDDPIDIRFPFQLQLQLTKKKEADPEGMMKEKDYRPCPYPGFCLSCTSLNVTMLSLPTLSGSPLEFAVNTISYDSQEIVVSDPENCLSQKFLKLYRSSSLFHTTFRFESYYNRQKQSNNRSISFFNCSSSLIGQRYLRNNEESRDMISCPIYAADHDESALELDMASCTKMFDIVNTPIYAYELRSNYLSLRWSKPADCTECEAKGKRCRWKNNTTDDGVIQCLDCRKHKQIHVPTSLIISVSGSILLGLVFIGLFKIFGNSRRKKEDHIRVEKFLEDYRAQKPARFTYADIRRITNGFKEKLGEGGHGAVFKGKLSNEIQVAVKVLNNAEEDGKEFINEVGIMGKIHHINVARLLGFCAEGIHRALVYNFFPNGSLQNFIYSPDNKDHFLGWEKLQLVALGIAKGIEYLHQGCNNSILHFDINPHNVLLDDNFNPKISDFGLAKLCSKNASAVSMTAARGTFGYIAPEVFSRNFGNVSHKSDIYSYGMLLLEIVGGRKNVDMSSAGQTFKVLYPEWIHNLLEHRDIHIHIIEDESDVKILKKLAIVGLWCIQWEPVNRPSINSVMHMLETDDEEILRVPPNPFDSSTTSTSNSEINFTRQHMELEVIQE
ncbi:hypothetical protein RIF29_42124 [Crotalaria pallida]|uniref:Protein kinase domain-containing protein n=1 Tax=Crotalaria pallida TaxID=3830 RepID=A0AAN9HQ10_CROPI